MHPLLKNWKVRALIGALLLSVVIIAVKGIQLGVDFSGGTVDGSTNIPHPAKKSSTELASPDEIAQKLLQGTSARPIVPTRHPNPATLKKTKPAVAASGIRVRKPIKAKAGKVIADRLIRLLPPSKQCRWYKVAFIGDNTLREPPMRVLPNRQLERMRALSKDGEKPGVLFYISGEVHQYHGENYILIRSAVKKRNLDLF